MFETPILFLIFNREDATQQVFEAIRQQKPKYLYVAADGPRKDKIGEWEKCLRVRNIIKQIDWDCELKTLFREENLGCKVAVSSAITWFFEQVEQGIILEDDCLPDPSFFPFCEELLNKYKDDTRIGHIGGNCFFPNTLDKNYSYNFSSISEIWGWATWRRVWKKYDLNLSYWLKYKDNKQKMNNLFINCLEKIYFSSFISDVLSENKNINTWDTQYVFSLRINSFLSIIPSVNLVTNIGLHSESATHTITKGWEKYWIKSSATSFPLIHPPHILRNKKLENKTIKSHFFSWKRLIKFFLKYS
jgi:hypothetical protein